MKKWERPSFYIGSEWPEHYVFLGQTRDSDALTRSNFRTALKRLGGELTEWVEELGKDIDAVLVVRESHWACGWVEWIAIHESNTAAIALAEEMDLEIEQYPILDESDFSELEDEECNEVWANCYSASERLDYFRRHGFHATSISDLLKAIRGGEWYYAANMLNCPSDLLY